MIVPNEKEATLRTIGYIRCSTDEQVGSGARLEAQRSAIVAEVERRGWELVEILEDHASGKSLNGRHGLEKALAAIDAGEAAALVALDLGVDTTTPAGELVATS